MPALWLDLVVPIENGCTAQVTTRITEILVKSFIIFHIELNVIARFYHILEIVMLEYFLLILDIKIY